MLASSLARATILVVSSPVHFPDTPGYLRLARLIGAGQVASDQGQRTPGYSAFVLINGMDEQAVRMAQYALGLALVAGVFYVLWKLTNSQWLASLGAFLCGLNAGEIFFESALLTEALSTFLLVTTLVLLVLIRDESSCASLKLILLGAAVGILPLVRPLYVYMPLLLAIPVLGMLTTCRRRFWLFILPAVLPAILWASYLGSTFGYFGLQTVSGFGWTNHAGPFMRDAPEQYAAIRDIYLRHVSHGGNIWTSIPDMQRATGQSYPELSKTVQRLSIQLLMSHPTAYAGQVARGFVDFWKGHGLPSDWAPFGTLTRPVWTISRAIGILVSAGFCIIVAMLMTAQLRLLRLPSLPWPCIWLTLAVLCAGAAQAIVELGGAARFGVPTYPYVVVVALCGLDTWLLRRGARVVARRDAH